MCSTGPPDWICCVATWNQSQQQRMRTVEWTQTACVDGANDEESFSCSPPPSSFSPSSSPRWPGHTLARPQHCTGAGEMDSRRRLTMESVMLLQWSLFFLLSHVGRSSCAWFSNRWGLFVPTRLSWNAVPHPGELGTDPMRGDRHSGRKLNTLAGVGRGAPQGPETPRSGRKLKRRSAGGAVSQLRHFLRLVRSLHTTYIQHDQTNF